MAKELMTLIKKYGSWLSVLNTIQNQVDEPEEGRWENFKSLLWMWKQKRENERTLDEGLYKMPDSLKSECMQDECWKKMVWTEI
jgi:hypothetical protein